MVPSKVVTIAVDLTGLDTDANVNSVIQSTKQVTATAILQGPPGVGLPTGGTTGQVLGKLSANNYDYTWFNPSGTTTLFVAAASASTKIKALADYVCDGFDDQVEINAALGALLNSKGTVVLSSGDFSTSGTINLTANQTLRGNGIDSTRIFGTSSTFHVIHMGNRQVDGTMRNNMVLQDLTAASIGGANNYDTVWADGMGAGSHIRDVKASEGRYNFRLTDLDQCYLQGLKASNSRVAGIYCEVGLENTWGNVQFYSVWPELSDNNSTCILFAASASQTSPNRFDRVTFYGGLLYSTVGLTGTTGVKFTVGASSVEFIGVLSENPVDHISMVGETAMVWNAGTLLQNSGLSTNGFKFATNNHKLTVIQSRFQQMTNLFNGVSGFSNITLLGTNENQGSISNLFTGQFGARYGTDTQFVGDNILTSGGDNEHYSQISASFWNVKKGSAPSTATGRGAYYYRSSDGKPVFKDESGVETILGGSTTALSYMGITQNKTANFSAAANNRYSVDTTSGNITATLPATNTLGDTLFIQKSTTDTNILYYSGTINGTVTSTFPIRLQMQGKLLQGDGTGNWNVIGGDLSLPTLDLRFRPFNNRVVTLTVSGSTYTPNTDTTDVAIITSPAANFTLANPTGTPVDTQTLLVRVASGATGYIPTFGAAYVASNSVPLPSSALTASVTTTLAFRYDSALSKWVLLALDPAPAITTGITRSIASISTNTTAAASAATDYVFLVSGTTTVTLPTAVGNTNRYTVKNVGSNTVTVGTTSAQTIDGSTTITLPATPSNLSREFISDNANWQIV